MALVTSVRRESACSHLSESLTRESSGLLAGHLPHLFVLIVTSCCLSVSSPVSLLLFLSPPGVGGKGSLFLHRQNSLLGLSQASSPFKDILFSSFLQMFFPFFPCIFFFLFSPCIERKSFPDSAANLLVLIPVWYCQREHHCGVGENELKGTEK